MAYIHPKLRLNLRLNRAGSVSILQELIDILNFLRDHPECRVPEISEHIGKGISTIERYLKILKDNGLIKYNGAPKTGGYVIK